MARMLASKCLLKLWRKHKNYSQSELGTLSGVNRIQIGIIKDCEKLAQSRHSRRGLARLTFKSTIYFNGKSSSNSLTVAALTFGSHEPPPTLFLFKINCNR